MIILVLKLLKMAKGIRALLDTVIQALPQVGNLVIQIGEFHYYIYFYLIRVFYFSFFSSYLLHLVLNYSEN